MYFHYLVKKASHTSLNRMILAFLIENLVEIIIDAHIRNSPERNLCKPCLDQKQANKQTNKQTNKSCLDPCNGHIFQNYSIVTARILILMWFPILFLKVSQSKFDLHSYVCV